MPEALLGPAAHSLGAAGWAHIVVVVDSTACPHLAALPSTAVELGTPRAVLVTIDPVTLHGALLGRVCGGQLAACAKACPSSSGHLGCGAQLAVATCRGLHMVSSGCSRSQCSQGQHHHEAHG
jgi:hypothetical protein